MLRPKAVCVTLYGWHRVDDFMEACRRAGFRIIEHIVFIKSYESSRLCLETRLKGP